MMLLHPGALVGLFAAAAPVTIYLLLRRRKTGFTVPVRQWMLAQGDSSAQMDRSQRGWARHVYSRLPQN